MTEIMEWLLMVWCVGLLINQSYLLRRIRKIEERIRRMEDE